MLTANTQPAADLSPGWKGFNNYGSSGSVNQKDLVTATDMIDENMERGERQFAVKALPRGPSRMESPGGKGGVGNTTEMFEVRNFIDFSHL